jgi:glycosidase
VLNILISAYQFLIAKYDLDGFRIDTVKYVDPACVEIFGNAIREFAQSIGKRNFFLFGEIYDDEQTIANFVGRNGSDVESYGIDAALDFPLFFKLPKVAKALGDGVETIRSLFEFRKSKQSELLSTHGEAGRFFVTFLDNHDQHERFNHPAAPQAQVLLGYALLFFLQGIPSLYYGTEQGLNGTIDNSGKPLLDRNESSREALWGKPNAFDTNATFFKAIKAISAVRAAEAALRFGRLYFREVSGNGTDFGHSSGSGGVVAFSRILSDREVTVIANTHTTQRFKGHVLQDFTLNLPPKGLKVIYSNLGTTGTSAVQQVFQAKFYQGGQQTGTGDAARAPVDLAPMEIQVLAPA